jgi:transposase
MARPRRIDPSIVKRAQMIAAAATSVESLRRCQAVLLPALFGATLEQTADVLGVGRATVARLQVAFRTQRSVVPAAARNWGGRRQALLTQEEEVAFLKPWLDSAATGNLVVVSPIRAALAQRLGQPIKPSVVYRLLARHGWRKVAPDTRHPKSKPEVQEAWKKTPRSAGNPADSGGRPRAARPVDVSG